MEFVSENESVAIVSESGKITGISPGKTYITAKYGDSDIVYCNVTVYDEAKIVSYENIIVLDAQNNFVEELNYKIMGGNPLKK